MVAEILAKAPHSKNWQVRSRLPMKDKPSQRQVNRVIASLKKGDAKPSCPTVERTTIVMQDKPPQPSRTLVLSRYRRSRDLVRVPVDEFDPLSAYKDPAPREDQIWEPESN
jgi:hypothetical protein